jgi:hypothetical protein
MREGTDGVAILEPFGPPHAAETLQGAPRDPGTLRSVAPGQVLIEHIGEE